MLPGQGSGPLQAAPGRGTNAFDAGDLLMTMFGALGIALSFLLELFDA